MNFKQSNQFHQHFFLGKTLLNNNIITGRNRGTYSSDQALGSYTATLQPYNVCIETVPIYYYVLFGIFGV